MGTRRVLWGDPKQPYEDAPYSIDFRPDLILGGEVVTSATVTIADRDNGVDYTSLMLVPGSTGVSSGGIVGFRVAGGSDNRDYVATVRTQTSVRTINGDEADVIIPVRQRGRQ